MPVANALALALLLLSAMACGPGRRMASDRSVQGTGTGTPVTKASVTPAIASGQYSGITRIAGSRYAVVDDKLRGGGLVFFDIEVDSASGAIGRVRAEIPPATKLADVAGRDCEGVAYADGMLYVSAESDQSIREYDLAGNATGRSFAIPAELGVGRIHPNAGFEALTYNAVTQSFWTTTERPLLKDTLIPRLHRLQRFNAALQPDGQWLYQMDEPYRSQADTRAYIHGISAMTALDDGSLLVLEREVYVPARLIRAIGETFSWTKIYRVIPADDTDAGSILPKTLLAEFTTGAADLANYEGMCLGPELADGRRTLILIADSQGGYGGLTREYLKLIILP